MITHKSIGYNGRLGNQMFQYAALKAVSLKTGFDFSLPDHRIPKHDAAFDFTNNKWISVKLDLLECFNLNCKFHNNLNFENQYSEKDFTFDPAIFSITDNTTIKGYFQSYKYFKDYEVEIKKDFQFKFDILNKCSIEIAKYLNPVSVHIRRADYVNHSGYWNITNEYIQKALNQFTDREYTFLIFSDDIEWCKQIFPEGVVFIEGNTQFEDLCLMSLCTHNIISNSTYSWWGAYLNSNESKKVIAPANWFIPAKSLIDLYPPDWVQF
jgi:hypothetical protein